MEILEKNKEIGWKFFVTADFWDKLAEIEEVLKIPYIATVDSQKVGYGLADFYISWLRIEKGLQRIDSKYTNLAEKIMNRLIERAPYLFETPLMLCAVYLDPRINFKLTREQKRDAAMALVKIHERMQKLDAADEKCTVNDTLDEIQADRNPNAEQRDSDTTALLDSLTNFEAEKSGIRDQVTQFWRENGNKYPMIEKLARVIHSVGANQCCTERSFSSFTFIRSKHRKSMDAKNLSNLLMIRLNKDMFYQFRQNYVQQIMNS